MSRRKIIRKPFDYIREFDEPEPHYTADAREREAYYKRACQADFPKQTKHLRFPLYNTWYETYAELKYEKEQAEKAEQKRLEKIKKEENKVRLKHLKSPSTRLYDIEARKKWFNAVRYTFNGDAVLNTAHHGLSPYFDHENSKSYKGLREFPLAYKSGKWSDWDYFTVTDVWGCDGEDTNTLENSLSTIRWVLTVGYCVELKNQNIEANIILFIEVSHNSVEVLEIRSDNEIIDTDESLYYLNNYIKKECTANYNKLLRNGKL